MAGAEREGTEESGFNEHVFAESDLREFCPIAESRSLAEKSPGKKLSGDTRASRVRNPWIVYPVALEKIRFEIFS